MPSPTVVASPSLPLCHLIIDKLSEVVLAHEQIYVNTNRRMGKQGLIQAGFKDCFRLCLRHMMLKSRIKHVQLVSGPDFMRVDKNILERQ